ncbi:Transcriptional regulator [Candidatus Sulfopaludibacter sp. SbA3]|nr:Transcriptional regulator [Candidatus Sulfopaludibacter sp. SbA3]
MNAVAAVRQFNRFYTRQIGVLREHLSESPFSLAQARVLYELAHRPAVTAGELARDLDLDAGYLSRILAGFQKRAYLTRVPSKTDARQSHLGLTGKGKAAFQPLDRQSGREVSAMLAPLAPTEQTRLVEAMTAIEFLLAPADTSEPPYVLRPPRPGDMGWVIHRHGALYAQEYHWDESFEALVAGVVAQFMEHFDARRERCWIAERRGAIAGCIFLVQQSAKVAKLRLLLVEPSARGHGIGKRLVTECIDFARQCGYRRLTLWTNKNLHAARHIYEQEGFHLVKEEPHHSFGHDLVGQTWELILG